MERKNILIEDIFIPAEFVNSVIWNTLLQVFEVQVFCSHKCLTYYSEDDSASSRSRICWLEDVGGTLRVSIYR